MDHEPSYDLDDEVEMLEIAEQYAELKAQNGILFYEPHPKQDAFHRAGAWMRRYVRTGNRFGKSTMGAAEDVAWALGERPWYDESDPARYEGIPKKSNKILVICQDWDKVNEIFTNPEPGQNQGKIFNLLPKDSIVGTPSKSKTGVISLIKVASKWGGTSSIYFDTVKSFMANPMGQESSDWDAIHIDEPIPQAMWNANARGLVDRDGKAWFTCTPLREMWINRMFIRDGKIRDFLVNSGENEDMGTWWISGTMHDNPTLSASAKKLYLSGLSESERQCREKGLPLSLSGLVYKSFDYASHTYGFDKDMPNGWASPWTPPDSYTIRVAIDPHPEVPHAVLMAATSPHEEVYFFYEIFESLTADDLVDRINDVLFGYEISRMIMDPAGWITAASDKSCMASDFDRLGLFCDKASKDLSRGILAVQSALVKTIKLPSGLRVPWLRFGKHLTRTMFEFDNYEWQDGGKGKPVDRDDHMMENLYRLVIDGLHYIEPEKDSDRQIIIQNASMRQLGQLTNFSRPSNRQEALRRIEMDKQRRLDSLKPHRN